MPLPKSLTPLHIEKAVDYVERETADLIDIYVEQANVFSAIVGIFGTKGLDSFSPYKKHKHPDIAAQRFPDLSLNGKINPPPQQALESKGSKRAWDIQSHFDHAGWYVVWRYLVDLTETYKPGRPVIIWRVDVIFLAKDDWKYEKSGAGDAGGGRTHTFGVKRPATKLQGAAAYLFPGVVVRGGKPILA